MTKSVSQVYLCGHKQVDSVADDFDGAPYVFAEGPCHRTGCVAAGLLVHDLPESFMIAKGRALERQLCRLENQVREMVMKFEDLLPKLTWELRAFNNHNIIRCLMSVEDAEQAVIEMFKLPAARYSSSE